MASAVALTADGGRLLEDLGDLGVHGDHDALLHGDLLVAGLHLFLDPLAEGLTDYGRDDIADPLLGRLWKFKLAIRKISVDVRVALVEERHHILHTEALVPAQVAKHKR